MAQSSTQPLVTTVIPSFNQGRFLEEALQSVFGQQVPVEVFVMDGGSSDHSLDILHQWAPRLAGWRSHADEGQAAAINEGVALGRAPFVCWLNSDDLFLPDGLARLVQALQRLPDAPAVYARAWNRRQRSGKQSPIWVEPFNERRLATRCIIAQPATLIRRSAWLAVGGLDENLHMALDYDLWWRLYKSCGALQFVDHYVAVNRDHDATKTNLYRRRHYSEAIAVVRKYHGKVPVRWWLAQPYSVWFRTLMCYGRQSYAGIRGARNAKRG